MHTHNRHVHTKHTVVFIKPSAPPFFKCLAIEILLKELLLAHVKKSLCPQTAISM